MLYRFSPKLFRNQEDMTIKLYVARADECLFHECAGSCHWKCGDLLSQCLGRVEIQFCGPPVTTVYHHTWYPLRLAVGICFASSFFCWALRAFFTRALSLSDCAEAPTIVSSYIGSRGSSTISGLGPSSVSRIIFSFANSANLYCTLHFSQRSGGSGVGLSQKGSIPSGVRLSC